MTSGIQEANHARVVNALLVMVLDEKIQRFLLRNDPKAYNQALDAVVGYLTIEQKVNISTIAEEVAKEKPAYKVEFVQRRKGVFGLSLIRINDNLPVLDFYGEYKNHRTRTDVLPTSNE